jgi:hypothetical protein
VAESKKGVHLLLDDVLIGNRWTQRQTPAQWYEVGGIVYDVVSFLNVIEPDGSAGFNAQVQIRRSTRR